MVLFIDVTNACRDEANSGVMRVTRKLSRRLQERAETVFTVWDENIGQFTLPTRSDLTVLGRYDGPVLRKIKYVSKALPRTRIEEILPAMDGQQKVFLFTETADCRMLEAAVPWLHAHGFSVAAVFHDAIPVLHPEFCSPKVTANHQRYMDNLADIDAVLPTAEHNGEDLEDDWRRRGITPRAKVETVGLAAEMDGVKRNRRMATSLPAAKQILFVSTLEPRKNHIRFLKALEALFAAHPETEQQWTVHLVGNRYAGNEEIPAFVEDFCRRHGGVRWLGVVDDRTLQAEYRAAAFTAYPSEIEGFGMPIIESLWAGKPCLCSNEGSIADLAAAGGCCTVDVKDEKAIAEGLYRLMTDEAYYLRLQHEAAERNIKSWDEYADEAAKILENVKKADRPAKRVPLGIRKTAEDAFKGWNGRRIITVSNFYPPEIVGGAEIIAHRQQKALRDSGLARGIVLSMEVNRLFPEGTVSASVYEDMPVVRVSIDPDHVERDWDCFDNPAVNETFRELCETVHPDICHIHNFKGLSLGILAIAAEMGIRTVFTLHDNWGFCHRHTMLTPAGELCETPLDCAGCKEAFETEKFRIPMAVWHDFYRRRMELADAFISPSRYLADAYIRAGFDAHRMHVLWNGIDTGLFAGAEKVPSDNIRITYAGYFGAHKGVDILIRAVATAGDPRVTLNLAGDGEEEAHYRQLASELGIAERIRYWGRMKNEEMIRVYRETDIFCLPSVWPENQPVTITEAMACGIPVIASDIGGIPELVEDGVTGLLAAPGNAEALAEKIREMAGDPAGRLRMGEAGRQRMAENDFREQAVKLAALYDGIRKETAKDTRPLTLVKDKRIPYGFEKRTKNDIIPLEWATEAERQQAAEEDTDRCFT